MLKSVIIDDEPLCVAALAEDLKKLSDFIQIQATFQSATEAIDYLTKNKTDVVFLDIEMPGMNGIEMLHKLGNFNFKVIFTTAFDQFAIRAIRLNALDYLLKPVHFDELTQAVKRAVAAIEDKPDADEKIILSDINSMEIVSTEQIVFCESDRNYTTFYFSDGRQKVMSKNIGLFEKLLNPTVFFRIHQSYLVNLLHVVEIKKGLQFKITTNIGVELPVARLKRTSFLEAIRKFKLT